MFQVDTNFKTVEIGHSGGISYKDGKLCWAPLDQVVCADWSVSGGLKNVQTLMEPGMAEQAGACEGKCNSSYPSGILSKQLSPTCFVTRKIIDKKWMPMYS